MFFEVFTPHLHAQNKLSNHHCMQREQAQPVGIHIPDPNRRCGRRDVPGYLQILFGDGNLDAPSDPVQGRKYF